MDNFYEMTVWKDVSHALTLNFLVSSWLWFLSCFHWPANSYFASVYWEKNEFNKIKTTENGHFLSWTQKLQLHVNEPDEFTYYPGIKLCMRAVWRLEKKLTICIVECCDGSRTAAKCIQMHARGKRGKLLFLTLNLQNCDVVVIVIVVN